MPWWLILLQVTSACLVAGLVLARPETTIRELALFIGTLWLLGGLFDLMATIVGGKRGGRRLDAAVLEILFGVLIVRNPSSAGAAFLTIPGYVLAATGVVVGGIWVGRAATGGGWGAGALGAISFMLGLLLLARPPVRADMVIFVSVFWALVAAFVMVRSRFLLRARSESGG